MNAAQFIPEVHRVLERDGEPSYRLGQAYAAITGSLVRDWEEATSLPRGLRGALNEEAPAAVLDLRRTWRATDGTRKYLFYTHDGHAIETVMIPEKGRHTVCISTQVGCPMACKFCATGLLGIKRNLGAREIAEQVFVAARDIAPERVSNVVVMGMGEPMLNYKATLGALKILNDRMALPCGEAHRVSTRDWLTRSGVSRTSLSVPSGDLAANPFEDERREISPSQPHTIPELMDAARTSYTDAPQALLRVHSARRVNDQPRTSRRC